MAHGGAGNRRSCMIEERERGRKKRADERSEAADQQNGSWEGEWRMENDEWDRDWCECEERERVATLRRVPTCRTWRARVVWCCEATRRAALEAWRGVQRARGPEGQASRRRRSRHGSPEARDSKSRRASEGRRRPLSGRGGAGGASGGSGGRRGGQRDLSTVSGGGGEGSTQGHFRQRPGRNSRNMEQAGQWRIVTIRGRGGRGSGPGQVNGMEEHGGSWGLGACWAPSSPLQPRQSRPMQAINGEHPTLKHLSSCWHLGTGHLALTSLHKWPWEEPLIPALRASMLGEMSGSAHH